MSTVPNEVTIIGAGLAVGENIESEDDLSFGLTLTTSRALR